MSSSGFENLVKTADVKTLVSLWTKVAGRASDGGLRIEAFALFARFLRKSWILGEELIGWEFEGLNHPQSYLDLFELVGLRYLIEQEFKVR